MNTPVSFPMAKLLKNKGFDEITNYNYSEVYGYVNNINSLKHSDGDNRFVSAPTISEVVMWLYEKYGIWITVCVIGADGFGYWLHNKNRKRLNTEDQGGYWYSPTEAYETAIEYTLKNLI